ncbi:MAG TPA: SDR family oxidoreductase [Candidatus Hydrogenedentes bacterium]|nr:SDR family oxidoreductase [Candidatus Hydrogenedentota bacterium]HIJ74151.1 SDR family oxidoreductase [Candidatus Hydrogenedentota bacterium]
MMCDGKVAVVTGAAGKGMGRSIALTLAREGAKIVVNYRTSEESAGAIVKQIEGRGGEGMAVQGDVFEADGCKRLVDAAVAQFGQVDICVVGPGAGWHPDPVHQLEAASALDDIHSEVAPIYHLMPLVLPGMYERGWGRFIALGLSPPYACPSYAYSVGKAARAYALRLARDETWQHGVTMNVIGPGPVAEIATLDEAVQQCDHEAAWQKRSTASPQDIAEGVAFLCSEAGRFISGCELPYMFRG